jgi:hypothetical protein
MLASLVSYIVFLLRLELLSRLNRTSFQHSSLSNVVYNIIAYNIESCILTLLFNKPLPYTGNISSFIVYNRLNWLLRLIIDDTPGYPGVPSFSFQILGTRYTYRPFSNENIEEEFDDQPRQASILCLPPRFYYTKIIVTIVVYGIVYVIGFVVFTLCRRFDTSMAKLFV